MNSKERMLVALNKGVPDKLPITVHQWLDYHLDKYMGGIDVVQASKKIGIDCSLLYEDIAESGTIYDKNWIVEITNEKLNNGNVRHTYIIDTPKGRLVYKTEENSQTVWIIEPLIKNKEDIELLEFLPLSKLDRKKIVKIYDYLGDSGILRGLVWGEQGGCWQHACVLYGTVKMLWAAIDDPAWVHEFLKILLNRKLDWIDRNMKGAKFDLVENGGGDASSTVISPAMFEEFCLPYDRLLHDVLHNAGQKVVYHTCGGMYGLFELIIATNTDASETLTSKTQGGNIEGPELYKAMHGRVSLIGGMDVNLLENGNPEKIKKEVKKLFEIFGKGGGYICSSSDNFFEAPIENLIAFAEAARNCEY